MKFKFKIQDYQTRAVESVVEVFAGQPHEGTQSYTIDKGKASEQQYLIDDSLGYRNAKVALTDSQLLENIRAVQEKQQLVPSERLVRKDGLGKVMLDVEMETGTGKTYVYIKTMYELHERYGWSKFMVVVPSIAIREGVKKSFEMLQEHFMEQYGCRIRSFVYQSDRLDELNTYSTDGQINVMIINTQAFNASFKTNKAGVATNKASRIIYSERDDFQSRRPIDVIAANAPIVIMDEPQKMEGEATQQSLTNFKPLFVLNYSATHRTKHNCVYSLDALDAYQERLVKKIEVKGITLCNLTGRMPYFYFDGLVLSKNKAPRVRLEIEVAGKASTQRRICSFEEGDKIYDVAQLEVYRHKQISEIDVYANRVVFTDGTELYRGEMSGNVAEETIQRAQVRETIKSHLEKERELFRLGVKTLSLFFIDKVCHYKSYDEGSGEEQHGRLWQLFEQEYERLVNEEMSLYEDDYQAYLKRFKPREVHKGYFSIDKKGRAVDSAVKRGWDVSDDESAYDLILKHKERLLDFDEPTRFIFSHSALREGWDNPNVFQICTLRHASSTVAKRQEVGRGLRICVDREGNRMDKEYLKERVHEVNKLTVVANESYKDFVKALQSETMKVLRERPKHVTVEYLQGKWVTEQDERVLIDKHMAKKVYGYLIQHDYIDEEDKVTRKFREEFAHESLAAPSAAMAKGFGEVMKLVAATFDETILQEMAKDGNQAHVMLTPNKNVEKKEFQALWKAINHKYAYTVHYDSEELIENAVDSINAHLQVARLRYQLVRGEQAEEDMTMYGKTTTRTGVIELEEEGEVGYDLLGEVGRRAKITRRTAAEILTRIAAKKYELFEVNPEEFIRNVVKLIREQKASMIVDHIVYNKLDDAAPYSMEMFTCRKTTEELKRAVKAQKGVMDYVFTDSKVESDFAMAMEAASEVCVYAKLPKEFHIPTPVGDYNPDWAIAFHDGMGMKHLFFIAETKGCIDSMELRPMEMAKISCAKKVYNLPDTKVHYAEVANYAQLMDLLTT